MTPGKPHISIIVAIADNMAIGKDNNLLWHISEDLRYFKSITGGHTVIMGRKTWDSLGRPLPNRRNIVISRTLADRSGKEISGVEFYPSLETALEAALKPQSLNPGNSTAQNVINPNVVLHTHAKVMSGDDTASITSNTSITSDEVFIIGGGEIYRQAIPIATKIYATLVHINVDDADTFFPEIDSSVWHEIHRESFPHGEKFEHPFEFVVFEK